MQQSIRDNSQALSKLCREFGIARLDVFGSAATERDFDILKSDADFIVSFERGRESDLAAFADLKDALEALLQRPVDLVDREAIERSRNFIRRRRILSEAQPVYG